MKPMLALPVVLALTVAIVGCTESPVRLRIVAAPPAANMELAALLASASGAVAAPVRIRTGASVVDAEEALAALDAGTADLALVENSLSFRDSMVRTVAPLYPSVLHIGVRPDKRGQSLRDVFAGATVYAGDEQSAARQLLNRLASIYSWTGVEFSYVETLESGPDVVFMFAPISPSAAPILDGYELLSLGRVEDVGRSSLADGVSLVAPFLRPFVIPEGTYGRLTPTAVATVAIDTLLVTRADIPRVVIFDLAQAIQMMGPLLFAQRPDLAIDELEDFQIAHLTFPVHPGALAFRARNDPGFFERASGIFEVIVSVVAALGTALVALLRTWRARKKSRVDKFYAEALAIRAKFSPDLTAQQRTECVTQLRALRDHAFSLLIGEKLSADESFQILQALIHNVILEFETPSGSART